MYSILAILLETIKTHSKLPVIRHVWGMGLADYMRNILKETNTQSKHIFTLVLGCKASSGLMEERF
jgi:hypothetical protein